MSRSMRIAVAGVALLMAVAQVAEAQPRGGRRGGGRGFGAFLLPEYRPVQLVGLESVQEALALTDEQKESVATITEEAQAARTEAFEGGNFDPERFAEIDQEAENKLRDLLNEEQQQKLMAVIIQANGAANALTFDVIAAAVGVASVEQESRIRDVRDRTLDELVSEGGGFRGRRGGDPEEFEQRRAEIRAQVDEAVLGVLTEEQREKFDELKGDEEIELDLSSLQGRGGRGFGGGRRGGGFGGRGGRGRGGPAPDADDANDDGA